MILKIQDISNSVENQSSNITFALTEINRLLQHQESQRKENIFNAMACFVSSIATQDPSKFHYDNVRAKVAEIKEALINEPKENDSINASIIIALDNPNIIDKLTRELIDFCKILNIKLSKTKPEEIEQYDIFIWDKIYLDLLSNYGKEGEIAKKEILPICKTIFKTFKQQKTYDFNGWVQPLLCLDKPFHISEYLGFIVSVFWEEKLKHKARFAANNPAGTTNNVTPSLVQILSPKNTMRLTTDHKVHLENKYETLGSVNVATFNSKIIERLISSGIDQLASLTAIKLVRRLIQETHDRFSSNDPHFFEMKFPGRATEIAKWLGLKSNQDITTINAIIMMLDSFRFNLPGINSRLIAVADCKPTSQFSRQDGWIITILPPLRPNYVFTDKGSLIIPLLKEPIAVGNSKYHAAQYVLQWKITEEFSKQSVVLAQTGWIIITQQQWKQWFFELNLPDKILPQIHEVITGENGYLEHKEKEYYSLKNQDKPLRFLQTQGKKRILGSKRGKSKNTKKEKHAKR